MVAVLFALETHYLDGQFKDQCTDMLTLMAYANAENRYCRTNGEWMAYYMYLARRKGYREQMDTLDVNAEQEEKIEDALQDAKLSEKEQRVAHYAAVDLARVPIYSVTDLAAAKDILAEADQSILAQTCEQYAEWKQSDNTLEQQRIDTLNIPAAAEREAAQAAIQAQRDNIAEAIAAARTSSTVLDAVVSVNELTEKGKQLKAVLRFEHTVSGAAKTAFMQQEAAATGKPFTDNERLTHLV